MATLTVQIDPELLRRVQEVAARRGMSVESVAVETLEELANADTGGTVRSLYDDKAVAELGHIPLRAQIYR